MLLATMPAATIEFKRGNNYRIWKCRGWSLLLGMGQILCMFIAGLVCADN